MMKNSWIKIILLILIGCTNSEKNRGERIASKNKHELELDTILEISDPNSLDYSKHQLFIDTTKSSFFYKKLIRWNPEIYKSEIVETYIYELNKLNKYQIVENKYFPKSFIKINEFNGKFYLYERCDGIDERYEIRDSAFITYGVFEADAETIKEELINNYDTLKLKLNSFEAKTDDGYSIVEIVKTNRDGIYLIDYKNKNYHHRNYVISTSDLENYNLIINHCPNWKAKEFESFYK